MAAAAASKPVIDWMGFVVVAVVTLVGAGFVVVMYSLGVRLTAVSGDGDGTRASLAAKWGAYVSFGFSVLAVVIGIVLIVPPFYKFAMHLFGITA
ncbi:hypothetical protein G6N77_03665 [Arthrobacter silviterrae]|uniref:DUF2516 family protein n=2 Tax=Arthrobacter TaxID=1663 RepID=A0ABX0DEF6_9MICC|nr:hypothetical protein [Arthrobacter silviterrae]